MIARTGLLVLLLFGAVACSSLRYTDDDGDSESTSAAGGAPQGGAGDGGATSSTRSIEVAVELDGGFPADQVLVLVSAPDGALLQAMNGNALPTTVEVTDGDLVSFVSRESSSTIHSFRVTPETYRVADQIGDAAPPTGCNLPSMQLVIDVPPIEGANGYELATDTGALRDVLVPGTVTMEVTDCAGAGSVDLFAFATSTEGLLGYELVQDIPFEAGASVPISLQIAQTQRVSLDIEISGLGDAQYASAISGWKHVLGMELTEQANVAEYGPTDEVLSWQSSVIDPGPGYGLLDVIISAKFPSALGCKRRASILHRGHAPPAAFDATRLAEVEPAGAQSWAFADPGEPGDVVAQSWHAGDDDLVWTTWEDAGRPALEITFPVLPDTLPDGFVVPADELQLYSLSNQDFIERASYADAIADPGAETRQWRAARYDCGDE